MRIILPVLLLGLAAAAAFAMGSRRDPVKLASSGLKGFVDAGGVPGLTAAFVTKGSVSYYSYGSFPAGMAGKLDPDTLFAVASVSKLFTTVAMADLVREGRLAIEDPLAKHLPAGVKVPSRNGKVITLKHLATHTSGLGNLDRGDAVRTRAAPNSWEAVYEGLAGIELPTDPGESFEYSNIGMVLLGRVVELVSGRPYEEFVIERILTPLGMDATRVTLPENSGKPVFAFDIGIGAPAGGFNSTARDLAKFAQAALGSAPVLLMEDLKITYQPQGRDVKGRPLYLGWHEAGRPGRLSHGGLQHAYVGVDLKNGVGTVILCTGQTTYNEALGAAVLSALAGEKADFPRPRPVVVPRPGVLEKLAGEYRLKEGEGAIVVKAASDGRTLLLSFKKGQEFTIWPETEDLFYCREWACDLQFAPPKDGSSPSVNVKMANWQGEYFRAVPGTGSR
jgi:CubicO group peptidase (beta-lactamase class C family)